MENNKKEPEKVELDRTETCLQKDYQKLRSKKKHHRKQEKPQKLYDYQQLHGERCGA